MSPLLAVCLNKHVSSNKSLKSKLHAYGVEDVVQSNSGHFSQQTGSQKDSSERDVLLLGPSSFKLASEDIRRLTINTVRVARHVAVWDGPSSDNLVAARIPGKLAMETCTQQQLGSSKEDVVNHLINQTNCQSYDLNDFTSREHTRMGGSFAASGVVKHFRKSASGRGAVKLRNENDFYLHLPEEIAAHYPELLYTKNSESESGVTFGIAYHDLPNLRDLLLDQQINAQDAAHFLGEVLEFEYNHAYQAHLEQVPSNYLNDYHFVRAWRRIHMSRELDPFFIKLSNAKWLQINGRRVPNIPAMLFALEKAVEKAPTKLLPEGVSKFIHADLHLENILVDRQNHTFWLIDPRGYPVCDIYYDLGKLAHSYNGLYDLLHEGRYEMTELSYSTMADTFQIDFEFNCPELVNTYSDLNEHMKGEIHRIFGATTDQQRKEIALKTRFNEAIHFCSDMPFHIDANASPNIAVAIYATGALLLAETLELLDLDLHTCTPPKSEALARLAAIGTKRWRFEA